MDFRYAELLAPILGRAYFRSTEHGHDCVRRLDSGQHVDNEDDCEVVIVPVGKLDEITWLLNEASVISRRSSEKHAFFFSKGDSVYQLGAPEEELVVHCTRNMDADEIAVLLNEIWDSS